MTLAFDLIGLTVLVVLPVGVIALVITAAQNRRHSARTEPRVCRSCGLSHPPFAEYCRKCGHQIRLL